MEILNRELVIIIVFILIIGGLSIIAFRVTQKRVFIITKELFNILGSKKIHI